MSGVRAAVLHVPGVPRPWDCGESSQAPACRSFQPAGDECVAAVGRRLRARQQRKDALLNHEGAGRERYLTRPLDWFGAFAKK